MTNNFSWSAHVVQRLQKANCTLYSIKRSLSYAVKPLVRSWEPPKSVTHERQEISSGGPLFAKNYDISVVSAHFLTKNLIAQHRKFNRVTVWYDSYNTSSDIIGIFLCKNLLYVSGYQDFFSYKSSSSSRFFCRLVVSGFFTDHFSFGSSRNQFFIFI